MLTGLLAFFGGNAFRWILGEASALWTRWQDHRFELQRMAAQAANEAAAHARQMESIRLQADLGVRDIQVRSAAVVAELETQAWGAVVEGTTKPIGIGFIDAWNGAIRPLLASIAIFLWVQHVWTTGWKLDDMSWSLVGAVLGIYVADRQLFKRGK